jgi:branched-chain amino acid transport system permease protein
MNLITLLVAGLALGSLYSLVALGLVLIYKTQDVTNFAHGELLMVGAFAGYTAFDILKLPYWTALIVAVATGALLGFIIQAGVFRRIRGQSNLAALAMLTVGISVLLKGVARVFFEGDVYTFPSVFASTEPLKFGSIVIAQQSALVIGVTLVLTALFFVFFRFASLGKQMRAVQQNIAGAKIVGINTDRVFVQTWMLAGATGAAAGILAAPISLLFPDMGTTFLMKGFAAAVVGGFGNIPGVVAAGFFIGVLEMLAGGYISTSLQEISAFLIIIIVLFIRPEGLFGTSTVRRV